MLTAEQKRLIYGEIQEIREERDYAPARNSNLVM